MPVTIDAIRSLSDEELEGLIVSAAEEKKAREERHKRETIARIKELAQSVGVQVAIGGARGRPRNPSRRSHAEK
jgi:hypothetical protein